MQEGRERGGEQILGCKEGKMGKMIRGKNKGMWRERRE